MIKKLIKCEKYYIASLDLLAGKSIINNDVDDEQLNLVNNIYKSWLRIHDTDMFLKDIQIKIFSDNIVLAIKTEINNSIEHLLKMVSYMTEHFLICGYKIRGAITIGDLYISDVFVWGKGLVEAYLMESNMAVNPRVIIKEEVVKDITSRTREIMIPFDSDYYILDYLKGYGKNAEGYLKTINDALAWLEKEPYRDKKIQDKNDYLKNYLLRAKEYWEKK